jgi:hypothetical protein
MHSQRFDNIPDEVDWDVIESFVGFGNPKAPVVFVGMEEGLAKPEFLQNDLRCRSLFDQVMDVHEAHCRLGLGPRLFDEKPRAQRTWWVMSDVMLHFANGVPKDKKERAEARRYYRTKVLGNKFADTLLMDLFPYPHPSRKMWLYQDRYATRQEYEAAIIDDRIDILRSALQWRPREAIICYGRELWDEFKCLFPEVTRWEPRNHCIFAEWNGAKVTLTNHFIWSGFNADQQLDELAATVLPKNRNRRSE